MVCEDTTLRYFNTKKPVTIQVDASSKGLGATLIQDDGPAAFASKVHTPTESVMQTIRGNCSPVSLVQNISGYIFYIFGRHFMIKIDYKSLEQISIKNLADAPVHLQRMLLSLQDYDFIIKYHPGEEMVVADTLSRYLPHVYIDAEKKQDYQLTIKDDPQLSVLSALADMIIAGWPDKINNVPKALRPYHGQCDSLTVEDGLILCGEAIIVPQERGRRSWNRYMKDTWAHQSASTGQDNALIGLALTRTSNNK